MISNTAREMLVILFPLKWAQRMIVQITVLPTFRKARGLTEMKKNMKVKKKWNHQAVKNA